MKKLDKKKLSNVICKELFENSAQINLPVDDGMYANNTRGSQFDRPYTQKDQLPLAPSDVVVDASSLTTKDFNVKDKSFVPQNEKEMVVALSSIVEKSGLNKIPKKDLEKMWKIFIKYFDID